MVVKIVVVVVVVATHLTLDRIVPDANILSYSKCRFTNINERFSFRRGTLGEWNIPWSTCLHDLFLMGDSLLHVGCLLHWFFSCCICFPFFFFFAFKTAISLSVVKLTSTMEEEAAALEWATGEGGCGISWFSGEGGAVDLLNGTICFSKEWKGCHVSCVIVLCHVSWS